MHIAAIQWLKGLHIDLIAHLQCVATINENGRDIIEHNRHTGRAGKACQPAEPFRAGRHIFILMLIRAGNEEAVEAASAKLGAQLCKARGAFRFVGSVGESLEEALKHKAQPNGRASP